VSAARVADGVFAPPDPSGERGLNEHTNGRVRNVPALTDAAVPAVPD